MVSSFKEKLYFLEIISYFYLVIILFLTTSDSEYFAQKDAEAHLLTRILAMNLHTCRIVLKNHQVLTCMSVEQSLNHLESLGDNGISQIQIDASDGHKIYSYMSHSLEESLENLMNL